MPTDPDELLTPPDPQRVARRAMILAPIVCRGSIDHDPSHPDAIDLWKRLKDWVERLDLGGELEPAEKEMLYAPLGTLDENRRIRAMWHAEGLAILAWSLGCFPFPEHDEVANPFAISGRLGFLSDEAREILRTAELRSPEELQACRELLYAVHCRLREFLRTGEARDIAHWIEPEWLRVLKVESPLGPQQDLRLIGAELADVDPNEVHRCEWAICERHRAILWLVGEGGPLYSQVTVDT